MSALHINKQVEIDMGHRIPFYNGACANFHGHRYRIIVRISGKIRKRQKNEEGMLLDFGKIKSILTTHIVQEFDHKFCIYSKDPHFNQVRLLPGVIQVDFVPTTENLAKHWFNTLKNIFVRQFKDHVSLESVSVFETPNNWAEYREGED